ncbi:CDP-diacylglycerol--glycerol-3-phosphate 3-phosphatidyltransferase [Streptomyces carminius]|uniref:Phosphatidylinositol phosphate synthase n=1 Tax=Streptomyces carminius TaxID=2665496 RepID=A0A2M8LSS3_9ACTN|nr:CDP-alcohol phosphatidyltransferase family protein [Streptomyces carminius]PJE95013.1 CDP-diacylglycerol--glycerol-3-phosphate 3-phosphatidyltransferase [Streptomyces carminius]
MLNKYARAFFTRVLTPFAALLLRLGVSPDTVTLIGTGGVMAGALVFFPRGEFFWGAVVITLFVFSDLVDGTMARQSGRSSRWGAFLDSTLDRVADAAVFGGIALWYAGRGEDPVLCAVAVFCLASGQVVSYTKARGESIGLPVNVNGLVERAERLVISLVCAGLAGFEATFGVPHIGILLPVALWVVAAGSLVTILQRMVTVRREATEADAAERAGGERTAPADGPAAGGASGSGTPASGRSGHRSENA